MSADRIYLLSAEETRNLLDSINAPFKPNEKLSAAIDSAEGNAVSDHDIWKCTDLDGESREAEADAIEIRVNAAMADQALIEAIDADVVFAMRDEFVAEMFSVLADAYDTNGTSLIDLLAVGLPVDLTAAAAQDVFARLARVAEAAATLRLEAIRAAIESGGL